jgi:hypothetical protein
MSSPLSSGKDRDVTPPPATTPDPAEVRSVDIFDELQKALDATRDASASHHAPPLQPRPEDTSSSPAERARHPVQSKYEPPAAQRVHSAAAELRATLSKPSAVVVSDLDKPVPKGPEKLGSVAARASVVQARERRRLEERPAPEFIRSARPRPERTHPQSALAVNRSVQDNRGELRTSDVKQEDEELLRRIVQRHQPAPWEDEKEVNPSKRRWIAVISFAAVASLAAGSLGFLAYQFFSARAPDVGTPTTSLLSSSFSKSRGDRTAEKNNPKLVLSPVSGSSNRPVALGVNIDAATPGSFILIRGLQPGSRVTAGISTGDGVWRVPMRELPHAAVMPPPDFVGTMELSVDLRRNDDSVADSDVQRITWTAIGPAPAVAKPVKTVAVSSSQEVFSPPSTPRAPASSQASPPASQANASKGSPPDEAQRAENARRLDPEEIQNLVQRGDAAMQSGDIAAARLLLRRAAEAGNVAAAMALAASYDPGVLAQLHAMGAKADVGMARTWYQKAADWGSPDAKRRLQELAQQ